MFISSSAFAQIKDMPDDLTDDTNTRKVTYLDVGAGVHLVNNNRVRLSGGIGYQYGHRASESDSLAALNTEDKAISRF